MARKNERKLKNIRAAADRTLSDPVKRSRRGQVGGLIALGVGAAAASAVAAERALVKRDRARPDAYSDEPYGQLRGRAIGPVASKDGTLIHVEEIGAGPTIVFSHGFSLNCTLWHHQLKGLAADHRLVFYDHRGHGHSGRPTEDWSLDALAHDLDAVINDVSPNEPVIVVGHSMGGMATLKFCELFPEKIGPRVSGIVLADTTSADVMGGIMPAVGRRIRAGIQGLQDVSFRMLAGRPARVDRLRKGVGDLAYIGTRLMGFGPSPSPAQVAFVDRMLREVDSSVWINLIPAMLGLDVTETLPAIDVPTLVVVGKSDRLTPILAASRISEGIANSRLVVIEGAGHTPMLEKHEEFNGLIREFAAEVRTQSAR